MPKVIFVPGNGGSSTQGNWFPSVRKTLESAGFSVIATDFPDPELARSSFWLPFLRDTLKADEDTILVGHSSGAIAAMRMAEKYKLLGSVLVGTYYTDLGSEPERLSGYFNSPWDWKAIQSHQQWTVIFASQDDPWIPIEEPRYIHQQLQCEYHEYKNEGHFGGDRDKDDFPELAQAILRRVSERSP
jgi:uncharacterized protein